MVVMSFKCVYYLSVISIASNWLFIEAILIMKNDIKSTPKIITSDGYPCEIHNVTTSDGYILELHRIPHGDGKARKQTPVFLMHSLGALSNAFILMGAKTSIAYNLADAGFDVWLGNARGNLESRKHAMYSPYDAQEKYIFWDFSWEEIGLYDVSAITDYIINNTGHEKIHYIGHSQGSTAFLVLNTLKPKYNNKFASAHLLAPVSYTKHFPNTYLGVTAVFTNTIYYTLKNFGVVNMHENVFDYSNKTKNQFMNAHFWRNIINQINVNYTRKYVNSFGGMSTKQLAHYGQNIKSNRFQQWDYGWIGNQRVYGTLLPPLYDLTKVTVDTVLYYAPSDSLVSVKDVLELERVMPNARTQRIAKNAYTHNSFTIDPDTKKLVTDYIIQKIKAVENL